MQMFLDSADVAEIRRAIEQWQIDGVTTNPRHVARTGKPFRQVLEEIARVVEGTAIPVSVEVDPHLDDCRQIVEAGLELAALSPNFVVKVGAGEEGFRAIRELTARQVRVNATLIFTPLQAWHAARCGATYVSPFVGWREAHGDEARSLLRETVELLGRHGYSTQVLAAAIRNARQITEAALAGAHAVTAAAQVWEDSFRNPYTRMGHEVFGQAWDSLPEN